MHIRTPNSIIAISVAICPYLLSRAMLARYARGVDKDESGQERYSDAGHRSVY